MSAFLKFDFQKRKQFHFSEENYLNYKKTTNKQNKTKQNKTKQQKNIFHMTIAFSLKQWQTRTRSGPIWVPLKVV